MISTTALTFILAISFELQWTPNTEPDLDGYNVYREDGVTTCLIKINTTSILAPRYVDAGLAYGTTYTYAVTAVDASGNESEPSERASGVTVRGEYWKPPGDSTRAISETVKPVVHIEEERVKTQKLEDVQFGNAFCAGYLCALIVFMAIVTIKKIREW